MNGSLFEPDRPRSTRDAYVTVVAILRAVRPKSVLLEVGKAVPRQAWVPRSCLHAAADREVERVALDSEMALEIREWKAEDAGLI